MHYHSAQSVQPTEPGNEGKLDLDRPLKAHVPDHAPADPRGDKVTARHVLSHSTGYRNWRNTPDQALVPEFEPVVAAASGHEHFAFDWL